MSYNATNVTTAYDPGWNDSTILQNHSDDNLCGSNLLSDAQQNLLNYVKIHGYLASVVCVCGILGNLATIVVLSRPKMASLPVNFLLMMIAIAQLLLMTVYLPQAIVIYILWDKESKLYPTVLKSSSAAAFHYFSVSFTVFFHSTAIWHVIAVAMFRWLSLGIPNGSRYCTMRSAYICSAVLVAMNALLSIPNWIGNHVESGLMNTTKDCIVVEELMLWQVQVRPEINFNRTLFALFGRIIPSILLTILTVLLIIIMRRAMQRRQTLLSRGHNEESNRQREHNRTTGMLLAVVAIFLTVELSHGILLIWVEADGLEVFYSWIGEVIDLLTLLSFSANFILYTVMSRQFRTTFAALFFKKPIEVQSTNMRRLSTMVTSSMKLTVTPKRSTALSKSSNTSMNFSNNDGGDNCHNLSTPLMGECKPRGKIDEAITSASVDTDETSII